MTPATGNIKMKMHNLGCSGSALKRACWSQNKQTSAAPFPETTALSLQLSDDTCGLSDRLNGCRGFSLAWKFLSHLSKITALMHTMAFVGLARPAHLCLVCKLLAWGLTSLSGSHLLTLRPCAERQLCPEAKRRSNRAHPARMACYLPV